MKVALVNKNPAVSRLITLSLNKIGAQYTEFDDISGLDHSFDYVIVDSDIDTGDFDFSGFDSVMYLVPRGGQKPEFATTSLEKPFLPTEFINIFEQSKPNTANFAKDDAMSDFSDFDDTHAAQLEDENFELPKIDEELQEETDLNIDDIDLEDIKLDELDLGEEDETAADGAEDADKLADEIELDETDFEEKVLDAGETKQNLASQDSFDDDDLAKDLLPQNDDNSDINELSSLVDEIENMDDTLKHSDQDEISAEPKYDDEAKFDAMNDVSNEPKDEFVSDIDATKNALNEIEALDDLNEEENLQNLDESVAAEESDFDEPEESEVKDDLVDTLADDFDGSDEEFSTEVAQTIDENTLDAKLEEASDLNLDEQIDDAQLNDELINSALSDENLDQDEPKIQIADETNEVADEPQQEILQDAAIDESVLDAKLEEAVDLNSDEPSENTQPNSIDEIDEADMLKAFGLKGEASATKEEKSCKDPQDIKAELAKKITEHITSSLDESSIKEALKDMNIKINISFEEK
ncbi:saccharopine dehydrogenase [Campylobacter curvus]|uniref:saccharopine dehydrogenase n=1 Tax=Campylobacter curvus TaxID=200 RepID=UPI00146FEC0D|nr:saccharopine dehydrogenase [Campylobacter curvus]